MTFSKIFNYILDLIYPRRCPCCDDILPPGGVLIHTRCLEKMKLQTPPYCMKCGTAIVGSEGKLCAGCREKRHGFVRGRSLYEYRSAAQSIYRFKYGNRQEYATAYAQQINDYLGGFLRNLNADAIVPIPLHKKRLAKRGYNQARLLSREISRVSGIPEIKDLLIRTKNTAPMKILSAPERQKNLKNAFIVRKNSVKLKTIILVDDIYTTGATMDEAARALHEAGIPEVYFVALAGGASL